MWLCSEEVEEKPRLHTLHLKGLLELQQKQEEGQQVKTNREDQVWLPVRLQVDLQVVGAGEGGFALLTAVLLISGVQFDVAVPAALVLEEAAAEGAFERQLVAVDLLVALQVTQTAPERKHG